ncbi:unnamed protein product [Xylocopa violacea]|uniref:PROP1-like PPR domain-containing protein n=1 Tax=Xylocopa violacea TaxID=135666 RepID=A0ABP1NQK6_XYLVO
MFSLRKNYFLRPNILVGYIDNHYHCVQQSKQFLYALNAYYSINCTDNKHAFKKKDNLNVLGKLSLSQLSACDKKFFCTNTVPKDSNIFGDISYEKYERVRMDKAEENEEEFSERARIPRKNKFIHSDYHKLIKSHLFRKDLVMALSVLDLMKNNNHKPDIYTYKLLLSAFARQGDIKQCFKLYKSMRDRNITLSPSIYTSLINVCSDTDDKKEALNNLKYLREHFYKNHISMNKIHYITFIKAYSHHNDLSTAFQLADEARDRGLHLSDIILVLFHATISNKESGLKLALILWHKMKISKIKPNAAHYNLLLRAIRDTEFGDLKVNDTLISGATSWISATDIQIQSTEEGRPDLLASPPTLNTSLLSCFTQNDHFIDINSNSKLDVIRENTPLSIDLNNILKKNRLILFGGLENILKRMENDGIAINQRTATLILELIPSSIDAEEYFLKYIKQYNLPVDLTFYNTLIKRRCLREQYESAKDVLNELQSLHLAPNIFTFGVLAIGCINYKDGKELLKQMNNIGYAPNNKQ